ncbi:hypothetical protein ACHAQA_009317 [Verticillium albo-atrum]
MTEAWLLLQAARDTRAETATAVEAKRNAWSQRHENDDARVRYASTYEEVVEAFRLRYANPALDAWIAAPGQDLLLSKIDAIFARVRAHKADVADVEALVARNKAYWYRRAVRDSVVGAQAERAMGRQAYLAALGGGGDDDNDDNEVDWAAGADAIQRALASEGGDAPSVDDVLARVAEAGDDISKRADVYVDLFFRDPATGEVPASCASAVTALRRGAPLEGIFATMTDAASGAAGARSQTDQHRRKLAELKRAQAAHLRDKALKAESRQRKQGPRVDAEVYESLPEGVAIEDVRACALCQVLAGLGLGTQRVYKTPETLADVHDDHVRSDHACAAGKDCTQLTDEDVDMSGNEEAASPAICKECAETQGHAVVYCSTRCAGAHFRQHRETVHVPGRRDSSKPVDFDTKDLVFEDGDKSKYHAEDITKFVWTLNDALERFFREKNPDVKILSVD